MVWVWQHNFGANCLFIQCLYHDGHATWNFSFISVKSYPRNCISKKLNSTCRAIYEHVKLPYTKTDILPICFSIVFALMDGCFPDFQTESFSIPTRNYWTLNLRYLYAKPLWLYEPSRPENALPVNGFPSTYMPYFSLYLCHQTRLICALHMYFLWSSKLSVPNPVLSEVKTDTNGKLVTIDILIERATIS